MFLEEEETIHEQRTTKKTHSKTEEHQIPIPPELPHRVQIEKTQKNYVKCSHRPDTPVRKVHNRSKRPRDENSGIACPIGVNVKHSSRITVINWKSHCTPHSTLYGSH